MINILIYAALGWAVYVVYKQIFSPQKTKGCDKCAKK